MGELRRMHGYFSKMLVFISIKQSEIRSIDRSNTSWTFRNVLKSDVVYTGDGCTMTWHSSKMTHRETESYQCSATLLLSLHSPFLPIHLSPDPTRPDQLDPAIRHPAIRSSNPVSSGKDKTVLIGGSGPRPQSPKIQLHIYATGSKSEIFTAASEYRSVFHYFIQL